MKELGTVRCVADCACRHRKNALGSELGSLTGIPLEYCVDARNRSGEQLVTLIDALPEARDRKAAHDLGHTPVLDIGDEQAGRVRTQIDGGDAH